MKSPAFQWYAADYLADERVMLLSLESEAAYVRLLNYCWREGSIPSNPALCAPMCKYADVKIIKPALALFTKSPSQPGRLIHKRLEEERAKQEAFRAKPAEKGAKGGRPRKADEKPEESRGFTPGLHRESHGKPGVNPDESSSSSTSSSISSNDDSTASELAAGIVDEVNSQPESPSSSAEKVAPSPAAFSQPDEPLVPVDESCLTNPQLFYSIIKDEGYSHVDAEHYRTRILSDSKGMTRTARGWRKRIREWLDSDKRSNKLMLPAAAGVSQVGNKYNPPAAIPARASSAPLGANNSTKERWR